MNTSKLQYLNSVEKFEPIECNVDHNKEKVFSTFPYAYMNGKLHLGHLFSFSKADFYTYFKRLQGYNALLPMGFHCTGMPISANAYKLKQELAGHKVDVSIVNILNGLGFTDVTPFTDPIHWIKTFPIYATDSLKKFHAAVDWRRSFITTEINKYYDSFVRYQFNKLKSLNLLNFGKRHSIFCPIDQQACLDHDRRKGEGVKPIEAILRKIKIDDTKVLLVQAKNTLPIEKIVFTQGKTIVEFKHNNITYLSEEEIYENFKYQVDGTEFISKITSNDLSHPTIKIELIQPEINGKIVNVKTDAKGNAVECTEYNEIMMIKCEESILVESENFIRIFVPEDIVISRSGAKCVVSLSDQWYIDYSLPEWKDKARLCIDRMTLNDELRLKLNASMDWINKWGFSRSFGLGTHIPWDSQYLIDSLSDSTIYPAFYTVKHLLFKDLEGKDEIFPASELCDEVWKYIFGDIENIPEHLSAHSELLNKCKESFEYFYPVDLRVSGKDLIGNHLTFYILNHVALFNEKYWPKRIYTNGHLMLNSAKMSKSDGNFLTVEGALEKYGASATRLCIADCGDTNEDANFLESTANSFVLKLYNLTKTIEDLKDTDKVDEDVLIGKLNRMALNDSDRYDLFVNEFFLESISRNIRKCLESHEAMVYRDVLKYGFFENLNLIDLYVSLKGNNQSLINYAYKTVLSLMYPIMPSLSKYLIDLKFKGDLSMPIPLRTEENRILAIEHMLDVCHKINAKPSNLPNVEIAVSKSYCDWKSQCMSIVDAATTKKEILEKCEPIIKANNVNKSKGMVFCMDYFANKSKYLIQFDELDTLQLFKEFMEDRCSKKITVVEKAECDPLQPSIKYH